MRAPTVNAFIGKLRRKLEAKPRHVDDPCTAAHTARLADTGGGKAHAVALGFRLTVDFPEKEHSLKPSPKRT